MFPSGLLKKYSLHFDFTNSNLSLGCEFPDYNLKAFAVSGFGDLITLRLQNVVVGIVKSFEKTVSLKSQTLFGPDEVVRNFKFNFTAQAQLGDLSNSTDGRVSVVYSDFLQLIIGSLRNPIQTSTVMVPFPIPLNIYHGNKTNQLSSTFSFFVPLYDPLHRSNVVAEISKISSTNEREKKSSPIATVVVPIDSEKNISIDLAVGELFPKFFNKNSQSAIAHIDFSDVSNLSISFNKAYDQIPVEVSLPIGRWYTNIKNPLSLNENYQNLAQSLEALVKSMDPLDDSFVKDLSEKFHQLNEFAKNDQQSSAESLVKDLDAKFKEDARDLVKTVFSHGRNMHAITQMFLIQTLSDSYATVFMAFLSDQQKLELDQKPLDQLSFAQKWAKKYGDLARLSTTYIEQREKYLLDPFILGFLKIFQIEALDNNHAAFPDVYLASLKNKG